MSKITLTNLVNLQNETTAVSAINANNAALTTALDNTLSRDGTSPNTMSGNLDMNGSQILNLPAPATVSSPVRLQDVTTAPIINSVPPVGTSGATVPLLNGNNTFSGTNSFSNTVSFGSTTSFVGAIALGTPSAGNLVNCTNLPLGSVSGLGAGVSSFLSTPSSANLVTAVTDETGGTSGGLLVFNNNPAIKGTATNDNASAGFIGEYIEASVSSASPISLVTGTAKTVTSISLTAGDWDVRGNVSYLFDSATTVNSMQSSLSLVTNAIDINNGRMVALSHTGATALTTFGFAIQPCRFSLSSTTTIYLIAKAVFGAAAGTAYGLISARRVR